MKKKENLIRKHFFFYGRVQGVGFRYYAVQKARELSLAGWVENCYDGSVEMEVQGTEEKIEMLLFFLSRREWISIEHIDEKQISLADDRDFYRRG